MAITFIEIPKQQMSISINLFTAYIITLSVNFTSN